MSPSKNASPVAPATINGKIGRRDMLWYNGHGVEGKQVCEQRHFTNSGAESDIVNYMSSKNGRCHRSQTGIGLGRRTNMPEELTDNDTLLIYLSSKRDSERLQSLKSSSFLGILLS